MVAVALLAYLILFTQLVAIYVSCELVNRTVEENDPKVEYTGTGWRFNFSDSLYHGGKHSENHQDPNATAIFKFNGVAIYYLSSLWDQNSSTTLQLDSAPSFRLNLHDPDSAPKDNGTHATRGSAVRWSKEGLDGDKEHALTISWGKIKDNPDIVSTNALVDAFIYTQDISDSTVSASATVADTSTASPSASESSAPSTPIIIGASVGGSVLLVFLLVGLRYLRIRNSQRRLQRPEMRAYPFLLYEPNESTKNYY
ncbi:hypothetical protein VKT23_018036 [Stygiomarasmius scandens]|uniref:Uncharacterized protein n=1 Tax=Marasmiellus scandens TaxID=2682957 RepID=A0ABR1IQH7_9AGAR